MAIKKPLATCEFEDLGYTEDTLRDSILSIMSMLDMAYSVDEDITLTPKEAGCIILLMRDMRNRLKHLGQMT